MIFAVDVAYSSGLGLTIQGIFATDRTSHNTDYLNSDLAPELRSAAELTQYNTPEKAGTKHFYLFSMREMTSKRFSNYSAMGRRHGPGRGNDSLGPPLIELMMATFTASR
jgi:hypothetical protein